MVLLYLCAPSCQVRTRWSQATRHLTARALVCTQGALWLYHRVMAPVIDCFYPHAAAPHSHDVVLDQNVDEHKLGDSKKDA